MQRIRPTRPGARVSNQQRLNGKESTVAKLSDVCTLAITYNRREKGKKEKVMLEYSLGGES